MTTALAREAAISIALEYVPADAALIGANGHLSRALFGRDDREGAFYMIGSMGVAPAIALGVAIARPERRVVVFDGDGNLLMGMGTLATIAAWRPRRFVHVCFDNESHASTGGQRTVSSVVGLDHVAAATGYAYAARAADEPGFRRALEQAFATEGPAFVLVKILPGGLAPGTPRVGVEPRSMTVRLRRWLGGSPNS